MLVFRNQTDRVLVRNDSGLTFTCRQELLEHEAEQEKRAAFDSGAAPTVSELRPRPCDGCGTTLTTSHLMGDRLLKCPNDACAKLTYLTDNELEPVIA